MPNIVLASSSPRRRELLGFLGIQFQVIPSAIEEFVDAKLKPEALVIELASQKAQAVQTKLLAGPVPASQEKTIIIGADTIVVYDRNVLNKPTSKKEAVDMLSYLSNKTHKVYTGVAVLSFENAHSPATLMKTFFEVSKVRFRELSSAEN